MGFINENNILCVFTMPGVEVDSDIILWRDDAGDDENTDGYIIITEAIPTDRKAEDGKDITIYIGERFDDKGVCYLIADIESRYIIFASIPDYTDYYNITKFEPGVKEISNKFNTRDIFEYIDTDDNLKSEIFDSIEIVDS